MNALQQWYQYVDSVSRQAGNPPVQSALSYPRSDDPAVPAAINNTIDLGPRLRARRFLATLCQTHALEGVTALYGVDTAEADPLPVFQFEPLPVRLPTIGEYLRELPSDPAPWDGSARHWVHTVATRLMPNPPPPALRAFMMPSPAESSLATPVSLAESPHDPNIPSPHLPIPVGRGETDETSTPQLPVVDGIPASVPRHWDMLLELPPNDVAQNSYKKPFRESREDMVLRLLDPALSLEETARLLGVCPTTVRRCTNRGNLRHFRTIGNQRRFRLSDVLGYLETRAAEIGADAASDAARGALDDDACHDGEVSAV